MLKDYLNIKHTFEQIKEQQKTLHEVVEEAASRLDGQQYLTILFNECKLEAPKQLTDDILLMFAGSQNATPNFILGNIMPFAPQLFTPQLFGVLLSRLIRSIGLNQQHIQILLDRRLKYSDQPLGVEELSALLELHNGKKIGFDYLVALIKHQPVIDDDMMAMILCAQICPGIANDQQAMRELFLALEQHPEFLHEGRAPGDLIAPGEPAFLGLGALDYVGDDRHSKTRQQIINNFAGNQQIGIDFIVEHVFGNCGITLTAGALVYALSSTIIEANKQAVRALYDVMTRHGQILPNACVWYFVGSSVRVDADDIVYFIMKQPEIAGFLSHITTKLREASPWAQAVMHSLVLAIVRDSFLKVHNFTAAKLSELVDKYSKIEFIDPSSEHYCSGCLEVMQAIVKHAEYSNVSDHIKQFLLRPHCLRAFLGYDNRHGQIALADRQKISEVIWQAMRLYCIYEQKKHNMVGMLSPVEVVSLIAKVCLRDRNAHFFEVFYQQAATALSKMPLALAEQIKPLLEKAHEQLKLVRAQKMPLQLMAAQTENQRRQATHALLQAKLATICHVVDIAAEVDLVAQLQLPANDFVVLKIDGILGCQQLSVLLMVNQDRIVVGYETDTILPPELQACISKTLGDQVEFVAMPLTALLAFNKVKQDFDNGGGK